MMLHYIVTVDDRIMRTSALRIDAERFAKTMRAQHPEARITVQDNIEFDREEVAA